MDPMPYRDPAKKRHWNRRDRAAHPERYQHYQQQSLSRWQSSRAPLCSCGCGHRVTNYRVEHLAGHVPRKKHRPTFGKHPMRTRPPTADMALRDLFWAAGFLEGEGTFGQHGTVAAEQLHREPLDRLTGLFGGRVVFRARGNRKSIWHWRVSGVRGRGVMLTLLPLLSRRRRSQIARVLSPGSTAGTDDAGCSLVRTES